MPLLNPALAKAIFDFLTIVAQLVQIGIQYGPEIVKRINEAFDIIKAAFSGEPITEEQQQTIRDSRDVVHARLLEADAQTEAEAKAAGIGQEKSEG